MEKVLEKKIDVTSNQRQEDEKEIVIAHTKEKLENEGKKEIEITKPQEIEDIKGLGINKGHTTKKAKRRSKTKGNTPKATKEKQISKPRIAIIATGGTIASETSDHKPAAGLIKVLLQGYRK